MPRRRFSTPPSLQQPAPVRHTLTRARSEDDGWLVLDRDECDYLPRESPAAPTDNTRSGHNHTHLGTGLTPAPWSTDTLPLSRQPRIAALTRAFADTASLCSLDEADTEHPELPIIPIRTSSLEISRPGTGLGIAVEELSRPVLRDAPAKFVYKTPSHIILERDSFPFRGPAIMVQAPTPPRALRNVSGDTTSSTSSAPSPSTPPPGPQPLDPPPTTTTMELHVKAPPPLPFPLVPRAASPATIASLPSLSVVSLNSLASLASPTLATPPLPSTPRLGPSDPTARELAERSERVQTLGDAVLRTRAYSALMNRHCEALGTALESAAELQEARAEIVRLRATVEQYRAVNRNLVDWGMSLREENEVLRAEAGDAPGVELFDPERDMRSRDDEGAYYERRGKGYDEEDGWRIDERDEYEAGF